MKLNLSRTVVGLGAMAGVAGMAAALTVSGCGGSDNPPHNENDGSADVVTVVDAGADVVDGSSTDAAFDAPRDAGPDVIVSDGSFVPIGDFTKTVTTAFCTHLRDCCLADAGWNEAKCEAAYHGAHGYADTAIYREIYTGDGGYTYYDAGNRVLLDPALAQKCISDMNNFVCGTMTDTQYLEIKRDCLFAMVGQVAPLAQDGGSCTQSNECTPGNYCDPTANDGGGGCLPVKTVGAACGAIPINANSEECTYLGTGTPADWCQPTGDAGTGTCQPAQDAGTLCEQDWQCQTDFCASPNPDAPPIVIECTASSLASDPGVPNGLCAYLSSP